MLTEITPIIITFNEEANLRRTLDKLRWANEILIVDSGSTDQTLSICGEYENTRVIYHAFSNFAAQCNFALRQNIKTQWVLSMDADYVLSSKLIEELKLLKVSQGVNGYQTSFQYMINGVPLRASLYPPRICLYRTNSAQYQQDGHAHRVHVEGEIECLKAPIYHDDRKSYSRWIAAQKTYAKQEANKLQCAPFRRLSLADKSRILKLGPLLVVPYLLVLKGLILDGKPGWKYIKQRLTAERLLQSELNKLNSP